MARLDVSDDRHSQMLIAKLAQDRRLSCPMSGRLALDRTALMSARWFRPAMPTLPAALQRKCRITLRLARELVLQGTLLSLKNRLQPGETVFYRSHPLNATDCP